jgi:hypothetical protein
MSDDYLGDNHPEWKKGPHERIHPAILILIWLGLMTFSTCGPIALMGWIGVYKDREILHLTAELTFWGASLVLVAVLIDYLFPASKRF